MFSLDVRSGEDERLLKMEEKMKEVFDEMARKEGCQVKWRLDAPSKAVRFHDDCIECVQQSCESSFGEKVGELTASMVSGAGEWFCC